MNVGLTNAFTVLLAAWVCTAQNITNSSNTTLANNTSGNTTVVNTTGANSTDTTLGYKEFKLDFAGGITVGILIAVLCLILGLFYLLVGARYPKASVASCTFLFVTGGLFFLLNFFDIETYICLIVGALVGLVTIAITLKLWKVGLFVLGGGAGFVIWLVVKALAADSFTDAATIYASLAAVVLVCGLLALKWEKQIFITATSLIGSFFLVQGADALIPGHASVFSLINDTTGLVCSYDHEWCMGIYIGIFAIAVVGIVVQFKVTAKFYKKRRGVKNKSDFRRKRRGKRAYAKEEEAPRDRRKYRNEDQKEERKRERKHSDEALVSPGKGKLAEENAELKVRLSDAEKRLREAEAALDGAWDLTQEEKDIVTRFRVDKKAAKEAASREKKDRESEKERQRQEEEDAYAAKKNRKKTKDKPPPYKAEPEKKSSKKKKKSSEKKRRDSTPSHSEEDSAEG